MPSVCGRAVVRCMPYAILYSVGTFPVVAAETFGLNEVVVTGTRTEKPILDAPVRTEVVSRAEIERTHARDLKEALEDVPGLLLKTNEKSGYEAWLQGLDADRVLVVVDGEPITPSLGSSVDVSQLGTADIERVEIVKGATSALYGSSAMGGVINVITRKPERPLAYSVTLSGGSYGDQNLEGVDIASRHLVAKVSSKQEDWYFSAAGNIRDRDGFDLDKDTYATEGIEGGKSNYDFRLAYTPDEETELYFAPRYYREDISKNMSTFAPGVGDIKKKKREDAERFHNTLGAVRHWDDGRRLRAWLVSDHWQDVTQQDVVATSVVDQQRTAKIDLYRAEVQWDQPWGDSHLLTMGLLRGYSSLNQEKLELDEKTIEADAAVRNFEAYLQNDIFLNDQWELVPGFRIQHDSDFGTEVAPKINALYSPAWFKSVTSNVRIGYGKGYRVPNLKERFYVFDHSALGYMVLGSNDLVPESSHSYQLGVELSKTGVFHFDVSLFHNRITDLIDTDFSHRNDDISIHTYQNIARSMTQGVETSLKYRVTSSLSVKGSYTYLDTKDKKTGNALTNRPQDQAKLSVDYEYKPLGTTFSLRGVYQSEEYIDGGNTMESPSWTTWDLKINQRLSEKLKVFFGIDNVTNEHRNPNKPGRDFRPLEPRLLYLGLRYEG